MDHFHTRYKNIIIENNSYLLLVIMVVFYISFFSVIENRNVKALMRSP